MSYNVGVQCCRFCKALMTADDSREHICYGSAKAMWSNLVDQRAVHEAAVTYMQYIHALKHGDPRIDDDVRNFANLLTGGRWFPRTH